MADSPRLNSRWRVFQRSPTSSTWENVLFYFFEMVGLFSGNGKGRRIDRDALDAFGAALRNQCGREITKGTDRREGEDREIQRNTVE